MEIQRMEATGMLQGTDSQHQAIKLGTVCVILANVAKGGWEEIGKWSRMVEETSSICQQGAIFPGTSLGHEKVMCGPESTQPNSALCESLCSAPWPPPGGPKLHSRSGQLELQGVVRTRARWLRCYLIGAMGTRGFHIISLDFWFLLQKNEEAVQGGP